MGARVSRDDFHWTDAPHPHYGRRDEILKKHPEIKKLMGHDPNFKWVVSAAVVLYFIVLYLIKDTSWVTLCLMAYFYGGVTSHSLTLAIHDISHNMAFGQKYPKLNRLFGMWANLPVGFPMSVGFKKYHTEHHRYLGYDVLDTDIPTAIEAKLFCRTSTKVLWVFLQPLFYVLRPLFIYPIPLNKMEVLNIFVQLFVDFLVVHFCGVRMLFYMLGGTLISMGLHPIAGHFISEHYMFEKGFETYSYYGPLNAITFNVGYHMEHHDFPNIPSSLLPEVKRIANEYYETRPYHTSWLKVLYDFITDPAIGPYARAKRKLVEEQYRYKPMASINGGAKQNGAAQHVGNGEAMHIGNGEAMHIGNGEVKHTRNGDVNICTENGGVKHLRNGDTTHIGNGDVGYIGNGNVKHIGNGNVKHVAKGDAKRK